MTPQTIAVLRVLLEDPAAPCYGLEIVRASGLKTGTVHPILRRLEQAGLIESFWEDPADHENEGRPRRRYYRFAGHGATTTAYQAVNPDHVTACSRALNVGVDALYGPSPDPLRLAHEWLVSDTPVAVHRGAGRRVGCSLAECMEHRVIARRHLDDTVGGGDLNPLVQRGLAAAAKTAMNAMATITITPPTTKAQPTRTFTRSIGRVGRTG